jgi:translation initiation factor 2 alpha subunit (eIF-2alpha)
MNSGASTSVGITMTTYERLVQLLEKAFVASDEASAAHKAYDEAMRRSDEAFGAANAAFKDAVDAGGNEESLRRFGEYVSQRAAERSGR